MNHLLIGLGVPVYLFIGVALYERISNGNPMSNDFDCVLVTLLWPAVVALVLVVLPFCLIWDGGMWLWDNLKPREDGPFEP